MTTDRPQGPLVYVMPNEDSAADAETLRDMAYDADQSLPVAVAAMAGWMARQWAEKGNGDNAQYFARMSATAGFDAAPLLRVPDFQSSEDGIR